MQTDGGSVGGVLRTGLGVALLASTMLFSSARGQVPDFSREIAPLLAKHCLECHSSTEAAGGLNLSTPETALAGGDSGPAIDPMDWESGLAWQWIEAGEMPKDRPSLDSEERATLQRWLQAGAVWDTPSIDPLAYSSDRRAGYDWWSLRPIQRPATPDVQLEAWPINEIDRFILERLEQSDLSPSPPADRRVLIRRLSFDLLGLPPSPSEVASFVGDPRDDAYERLVDRLLSSPHYGERWARHWLDVVRFGETQGFERNRIRENAWQYRDWVVRALNQDMPYDEFVRWQIAGDVLEPESFDALMATGYHVGGTWDQVGHMEGSPVMRTAARWEHMEDLVATLGQSFLGLTVHCSRCHDHKYDPISQREYYQLAAALGGVHQTENERSGIELMPLDADRQVLNEERAELQRRLRQWCQDIGRRGNAARDGAEHSGEDPVEDLEKLFLFVRSDSGEITALRAIPSLNLTSTQGLEIKPLGSSGVAIKASSTGAWAEAIKASGEFSVEVWLQSERTPQSGPARIVTWSRDSGVRNFTLGQDGDRLDVRLRSTETDANGLPSFASTSRVFKTQMQHVILTVRAPGIAILSVDGQEVGRQDVEGTLGNWDAGFSIGIGNELSGDRPWVGKIYGVALHGRALSSEEVRGRSSSGGLTQLDPQLRWDAIWAEATDQERNQYQEWSERLHAIESQREQKAFNGVAHVIVPRQPPVYHVLQRGDPRLVGEVVSARGLAALSSGGLEADFGLAPDAPESQRRAALARWITDPRNPLTARVIVNRLWHHHFGRGIVDTPSDFGFSGGRPTHPELLDWLADELVRDGWSLKSIHRKIVLSATYRQASRSHPDQTRALAIDAENRGLWRANTRRLEAEAIRDAALSVSGQLNLQMGGPSFRDMQVKLGNNAEFTDPDDGFHPELNRRTLYRLWARSGHHPLLQAFDCPEPSVMAPARSQTITPIQAMQLLNNTRLEQVAKHWAQRLATEGGPTRKDWLRMAWQQAYARDPSEDEAAAALAFVDAYGWDELCLVLLNTNEFIYLN